MCIRDRLIQHVGQDAAVTEIFNLDGRIDAAQKGSLDALSIAPFDHQGECLLRRQTGVEADNVKFLVATQTQCCGRIFTDELQRQHAHPHQLSLIHI